VRTSEEIERSEAREREYVRRYSPVNVVDGGRFALYFRI